MTDHTTKLTLNGGKITEIRFTKSKGTYKQDEIIEKANKIRNRLKAQYKGRMIVTIKYDFGWRNGRATDMATEEPDLFDLYNHYADEIPDKYKDKIQHQDNFKTFAVYLLPESKKAGGCSGKYNDCLWQCLREAFGKEYLPKILDKPTKLKKMLGVARDAKVPLDKIPIIEKKCKININLFGDHVYRNAERYEREVDITLTNGHFKRKPMKTNMLTKGISFDKNRKLLIYEKKDVITVYDGKKTREMSTEEFVEHKSKPSKSKYILLPLNPPMTFEESYQEWTSMADELIEKTGGLINMYECGKHKIAAKYLFHHRSNCVRQPDPIEQDEAEWIRYANMGGLIWADKDFKLKNGYKYDGNSRYPSIMQKASNKFPNKAGKFTHLKELPDKPEYGIYRVKIHKADPKLNLNKYFKFNQKGDFYTHYDIIAAQKLGLKVELIQDEKVNALIYDKSCLVGGQILFKPFVEYMYDLKLKKVKGSKPILNSLWGALMEYNKQLRQTENGKVYLKDCDVVSIEPHGDNHWVETVPHDKMFVTDYARVAPFITSINRLLFGRLLYGYGDRVKAFHTDGFIIDGEVTNIRLSKKLCEFKLEKQGSVHIINACKAEWT